MKSERLSQVLTDQDLEAVPAALTEVPQPEEPASAAPGIWPGLGTALAAAVLLAAAAVLLRRRKRRRATPPEPALSGGSPRVGKVHEQGARDRQEDCFAVSDESVFTKQGLLAVVADGMGGLEDGEQVSETAVTAAISSFYEIQGASGQVLLAALWQANQAVNELLGPGRAGLCGSTLAAGLLRDGRFHYLSVGDSRICLYRGGTLTQLNREHVFRNELFTRAVNGEITFQEAADHPKAAGLTSFLGMGELKYIDLPAQPVTVCPGDKFILMSDGVYNALTDGELALALAGTAQEAADAIRRAVEEKEYPNQDNYTAVILAC